MLVSIVITNHNYARYLRAAIDSALGQTHPETEVLVVDDGSTDDSRAIIASYGARVVPIFLDGGGQAAACNAGVAPARGEAIILLDADDVLGPAIAGRVADVLSACPQVAWIQYRLAVIDRAGRPTGELKPPAYVPRRGGDLRRHIVSFPGDIVRMATSGNAYRAAALRRLLPIPDDVYAPTGADWYLCPQIGLFGPVVFLDEVGGWYRVHGANAHWYERQQLDVRGLRRNARYLEASADAIEAQARALGLLDGAASRGPIISVSQVATELAVLKLEGTGRDPAGRSVWQVLARAVRAVRGRFDVRWPMRGLYLAWFVSVALLPRGIAVRLIDVFFFPGKRQVLNQLLGRLHVPETHAAAAR